MNKQATRYGGVVFLTGFVVLVVVLFAARPHQMSHAEQPAEEARPTEATDPTEDDVYSVDQMTDLEKRIEQTQQQPLPQEIFDKTPREVQLEADLATCNKKLELLMYSKTDNPK